MPYKTGRSARVPMQGRSVVGPPHGHVEGIAWANAVQDPILIGLERAHHAVEAWVRQAAACGEDAGALEPVSYTHLTLPTILRV